MNNVCIYCKKNFSTTSNLQRHQKSAKKCQVSNNLQFKRLTYKCSHCEKELSSNQMLKNHINKACKKVMITNNIETNSVDHIGFLEYMTKDNIEKLLRQAIRDTTSPITAKYLAQYTIEYLLNSDKPVYICLDRKLQIFRYLDQNKDQKNDTKARALINLLSIYCPYAKYKHMLKSNEFIYTLSQNLPSSIEERNTIVKIRDDGESLIKQIVNNQVEKETEVVKIESKSGLTSTLTFNGIVIHSREDGMINATELCQAGGKKFKDWYKLDSTQSLIKAFKKDLNLSQSEKVKEEDSPLLQIDFSSPLVDIKRGRGKGTWIYRRLAVHLACWVNHDFAVLVSKWIDELLSSGSVTLGKERDTKEVDQLYKDKIKQLQQEHDLKYKCLENKHNNLLHKRTCYKFEQGPSFYIIERENNTYKIGITKDINDRLSKYRTLCPNSKLRYLVYCDKSNLIEDMLLSRFDFYKEQINHEVLVGLDLSQIIYAVNASIDLCKFSFNIVSQEQLDKYNHPIEKQTYK